MLVAVSSRLEFRDLDDCGIVAVVDGVEVTTLGGGGWNGLSWEEPQVVARMLQGWEPPPREDDSEEFRERATPIEGAPGWYGYSPSRVPLRLPGGDGPEIDSWDLEEFRDCEGIPVAGCGCGGGVGCAALLAQVVSVGSQVTWTIGDRRFVFSQQEHDRAIRQLLELVGETPRLIDENPDD
jgi:hypothetical protein